MKVLVLGSQGMAGHVVAKYLSRQGFDVRTMARQGADYNIDIEDQKQTSIFFSELSTSFDYVVNCIGLLVKNSIERPDRAAIINSWFPHMVEHHLTNSKTRLIHLSTDCVYDGNAGPYNEKYPHTELNAYGRSKSLGEVNNDKDITFRMSIIGPELKKNGTGLLHWVTNSTDTELVGWCDHYWNGITTLQLAKCIEKYMLDPKIIGIYNVVNNDVSINKYELVRKIVEHYNLPKTVRKSTGPKPANKVLVDTRKTFDFDIPNYDIQLSEMRAFV